MKSPWIAAALFLLSAPLRAQNARLFQALPSGAQRLARLGPASPALSALKDRLIVGRTFTIDGRDVLIKEEDLESLSSGQLAQAVEVALRSLDEQARRVAVSAAEGAIPEAELEKKTEEAKGLLWAKDLLLPEVYSALGSAYLSMSARKSPQASARVENFLERERDFIEKAPEEISEPKIDAQILGKVQALKTQLNRLEKADSSASGRWRKAELSLDAMLDEGQVSVGRVESLMTALGSAQVPGLSYAQDGEEEGESPRPRKSKGKKDSEKSDASLLSGLGELRSLVIAKEGPRGNLMDSQGRHWIRRAMKGMKEVRYGLIAGGPGQFLEENEASDPEQWGALLAQAEEALAAPDAKVPVKAAALFRRMKDLTISFGMLNPRSVPGRAKMRAKLDALSALYEKAGETAAMIIQVPGVNDRLYADPARRQKAEALEELQNAFALMDIFARKTRGKAQKAWKDLFAEAVAARDAGAVAKVAEKAKPLAAALDKKIGQDQRLGLNAGVGAELMAVLEKVGADLQAAEETPRKRLLRAAEIVRAGILPDMENYHMGLEDGPELEAERLRAALFALRWEPEWESLLRTIALAVDDHEGDPRRGFPLARRQAKRLAARYGKALKDAFGLDRSRRNHSARKVHELLRELGASADKAK